MVVKQGASFQALKHLVKNKTPPKVRDVIIMYQNVNQSLIGPTHSTNYVHADLIKFDTAENKVQLYNGNFMHELG